MSVKPSALTETKRQDTAETQHYSLLESGVETSPSKTKDGISPASFGVKSTLQQPLEQATVPSQVAPLQQAIRHPGSAANTALPTSPMSVHPSQTRTLSLQGLHGWTPFQARMEEKGSTSIPLWLYRRHFRHRPLFAPSAQEKTEGIVGSFITCARYKHKIVFLSVLVYHDSMTPVIGARLIAHFFLDGTSVAATQVKEKREKRGRNNKSFCLALRDSSHVFGNSLVFGPSWKATSRCPLCNITVPQTGWAY